MPAGRHSFPGDEAAALSAAKLLFQVPALVFTVVRLNLAPELLLHAIASGARSLCCATIKAA